MTKTHNGHTYRNITPSAASVGDTVLFSNDVLVIRDIEQDPITREWFLHCEYLDGYKRLLSYYDREDTVHLVVNPVQEELQATLGAALLPW